MVVHVKQVNNKMILDVRQRRLIEFMQQLRVIKTEEIYTTRADKMISISDNSILLGTLHRPTDMAMASM